ncbi:MAG TPA: HEAT repeat domain-containing protein [Allosphingosinicella sp.]
MIAGDILAAWLRDRESQGRSRASVQAFVDEWSGFPLMGELERDLTYMEERTPQAVIAAARRFFDRAGDLSALLGALIAKCREDPFFIPPFHPLNSEIHSGLLLYNHAELSIGFGVTGVDVLAAKKAGRRGPASIGFTGVWNLFRYVKAGNAMVSFWEGTPIGPGFNTAEAGQCRCVGRRRIADGEDILIDGSHESFIVDHADGDILYLQAMVRTGAAPLTTEYDSQTRSFIGATSTDEASSRVQMMATLLREMDRADAVPILRESLASPHFYTRWHLMRELLALDAEAALPDLRLMAQEDPHPEVRAAARQTLDMFFTEEADPIIQGDETCPA